MSVQFEYWGRSDLAYPLRIDNMAGVMFTQDNMANRIGVEVYRNNTPETLTGNIIGNIITPAGNTVVINPGSKSGHLAWIDLPQAAYAYVGTIRIVIKHMSGNEEVTIFSGEGYVNASQIGQAVDPGTVVPNINQLLDRIDEMEEKTADAQDAALEAHAAAGGTFAYEEDVVGVPNLVDGLTWSTGGISDDGTENTNSDLLRTGYIPVDAETYKVVVKNVPASTWFRVHYYDDNQTPVRYLVRYAPDANKIYKTTFDVPDTGYIRISMAKTNTLLGLYVYGESLKDTMVLENDAKRGLVSGTSEQLVSENGTTDNTAYLTRRSTMAVGNRKGMKIVGGSVWWNQPQNRTDYSATNDGVTRSYNASTHLYTISGTCTATSYQTISNNFLDKTIVGHRYLILMSGTVPDSVTGFFNIATTGLSSIKGSCIKTVTAAEDATRVSFRFRQIEGETYDISTTCSVFDLTAMFGETIADYLNSLETATPGAGVAWFKRYFPNDYYDHDAGRFISVKPTAHETYGFNLFDGKWEGGRYDIGTGVKTNANHIIRSVHKFPVLPGTQYEIVSPNYQVNGGSIHLYQWRADGSFIGRTAWSNNTRVYQHATNSKTYADAAWAALMAYKNGSNWHINIPNCPLCMHIAGDNSRTGEIAGFDYHHYALPGKELLGMPKIDTGGNLYFDGDEYTSDGIIRRNYVSRPYESGDAPSATMMTDGVTTIYKQSAATVELADPFAYPMLADSWTTERFVDKRDIPMPVGHETLYMTDLRSTLDNLGSIYIPKTAKDDAAFYGIALAAGDTTQGSSQNPLGTYTEEAKRAIREMLGLPRYMEAELIKDYTLTENLTSITLTKDDLDNDIQLRTLRLIVHAGATTTGTANDYLSANLYVEMPNSVTTYYGLPTLRWGNKNGYYFFYEAELFGPNLLFTRAFTASNYNSSTSTMNSMVSTIPVKNICSVRLSQYSNSYSLIPAGTQILIYGIRI